MKCFSCGKPQKFAFYLEGDKSKPAFQDPKCESNKLSKEFAKMLGGYLKA